MNVGFIIMLLEEERAGVEIKVPRDRLRQILEQDG
jgi:hypothetical protein